MAWVFRRPPLKISPILVKASATSLLDGIAISIQVLKKSEANRAGFFWIIPKIVHAFHELALQVALV